MITQVFINKESVESRRIKTCQEHAHHNQQIHFTRLHALSQITIIILKIITVDGVAGLKQPIVVIYTAA